MVTDMISDFEHLPSLHETTHVNDRMVYLKNPSIVKEQIWSICLEGMLSKTFQYRIQTGNKALGINMAYERLNDGISV